MSKQKLLHFGGHAATIPVIQLAEDEDITDLDDYVETSEVNVGVAPLVVLVEDGGANVRVAARVDASLTAAGVTDNWFIVETLAGT